LQQLRSQVGAARREVLTRRAGRVDPALLLAARGVLLGAMEDYAAELHRCRLPVPPGLRDDLRLLRAIPGLRTASKSPDRARRAKPWRCRPASEHLEAAAAGRATGRSGPK